MSSLSYFPKGLLCIHNFSTALSFIINRATVFLVYLFLFWKLKKSSTATELTTLSSVLFQHFYCQHAKEGMEMILMITKANKSKYKRERAKIHIQDKD